MFRRTIPVPFFFRKKLTYLLLIFSLLTFFFIRYFSDNTDYQSALNGINQQINDYIQYSIQDETIKQEKQRTDLSTINNKVIIMYSKNLHMMEILETLRSFELRSSIRGKHDFIILLESRPSNALKSMLKVMSSSKIHIVNIIDELRTPKNYKIILDKKLKTELMVQGFVENRRNKLKNIQRFLTSGLFELPEIQQYEYFWLLNDAMHRLTCNLINNPLDIMIEEQRKVGFMFLNSLNNPYQIYQDIWIDLKQYHKKNNIQPKSLSLISNSTTDLYNQCQFNSFGLMGYVPFFTSDKYQNLVKHLNDFNGMKYSLITDSIIFTMAFTSLLNKNDFRLFQGVGLSKIDMKREPFMSCPEDPVVRLNGKCVCNPIKDTLWEEYFNKDEESCISQYYKFQGLEIPQDIIERKFSIQEKKEKERIKDEQKQKEFDQIMEEAGLPILELQDGDEPIERFDKKNT